jgi:cytochrome c oxidase assembly protein subunit 15
MASFMPGLRRAAPRLAKGFFDCRHGAKPSVFSPLRVQTKSAFETIRFYNSTAPLKSNTAVFEKTPLSALSQKIGEAPNSPAAKKAWPQTSSRGVAYWLLASAASVFGIIVFGGLTRLTESGLSITEWKPVTGSLPPMSQADWEAEFEKYRASPEFKMLNSHMNLDEFKKIFYMEWGHRLWGRFVGLSFVLPALYFVARRQVSKPMAFRLLGISALIGFQGFIGWWMVKSGLVDDLFAAGSHPRVSQYRLTAHLGTAFICYVAMLWNGLSILRDRSILANPQRGLDNINQRAAKVLGPFRKSVAALAVLVFITAMSGGLVAGLDAGLIYNEFPMMGNGLTPPKSELFQKFYSRKEDGSDIWWRNMLENPSTVQLQHRILAVSTFTAIMALFAYSRFNRKVAAAMPRTARKGMMGVVHMVSLQVALGITTLLYLVPIHLASTHQAGSIALLSTVVILGNRIWVPKRTLRLVQQKLAQAAQAAQTAPKTRIPAAARVGPISSSQ